MHPQATLMYHLYLCASLPLKQIHSIFIGMHQRDLNKDHEGKFSSSTTNIYDKYLKNGMLPNKLQ